MVSAAWSILLRSRTWLIAAWVALAAATSLAPSAVGRFSYVRRVLALGEADRQRLLLGDFAPLIAAVKERVPDNGAVVLETSEDPGAMPYAVFPRDVYTCGVGPDSDASYFEVPPSPFPRRPRSSFRTPWHAVLEHLPDGEIRAQLLSDAGTLP
ncbi:MAG: hypothetical protein ACHQQS_13935 [Thermoanaerobaculales bacterium]